jgi:hypothetical protein
MTGRARSLAAASPPDDSLRTLVREMIEAGPAKITLASLAGGLDLLSPGVMAASQELRAGAGAVVELCADVSFESLELVDDRGGVGTDLPGCGADGGAGHGCGDDPGAQPEGSR